MSASVMSTGAGRVVRSVAAMASDLVDRTSQSLSGYGESTIP